MRLFDNGRFRELNDNTLEDECIHTNGFGETWQQCYQRLERDSTFWREELYAELRRLNEAMCQRDEALAQVKKLRAKIKKIKQRRVTKRCGCNKAHDKWKGV